MLASWGCARSSPTSSAVSAWPLVPVPLTPTDLHFGSSLATGFCRCASDRCWRMSGSFVASSVLPPCLTSVKQDWLHIGVEDAEFGSHADSSRCPDVFEHDKSCSCLADSGCDVSVCASLMVYHTSQIDEGLHLPYGLSTTAALQLPFFGNASGVNLEENSGVGVPKAVCCCIQLHSGNSCDVAGVKLWWPCCSFGSITAICVDTIRRKTDTDYQPSLEWRRARGQGLLPMVGDSFINLGSHWTAIAHLKLGSPQPVRCFPNTVCHPHWVHWELGNNQKQTATIAPGNYKKSTKEISFKTGSWNELRRLTSLLSRKYSLHVVPWRRRTTYSSGRGRVTTSPESME